MVHGFRELTHSKKESVIAISYNKYGNRMATGSQDHKLRVFNKNPQEKLDWILSDSWRAHNASVLDVKWSSGPSGEILASVGDDLKLKVWLENKNEDERSGRRWTCVFFQISPHAVIYVSLDFKTVDYTTYLAVVTRDGLISLLEPVEMFKYDDWKEIDSFWVCDTRIERGIETQFRLQFQNSILPNYLAIEAGLDQKAMSLVVSALEDARVYRILRSGGDSSGSYRFQAPVAVLTGARGLVRDVAWSPVSFQSVDRIATASADGYIRIYELWVPKPVGDGEEQQGHSGSTSGATGPSGGAGTLFGGRAAGKAVPSGIGAGLAGASRIPKVAEPEESGLLLHDWRLVAEIKSEGVWRVEFMWNGVMLVSAGDSGRGHVWGRTHENKWLEFAEFGSGVDL